ncbi:MAG: hypothetical protein COU27_00405 [Candidatus Levybacteria bacterium CG10_big_fil_rev_8_21_14_0_10_36_7]|nr:MAG: hypothetical protein COU27_00405 [Candidatus Levybacteria bacterium CG10_big_fil_rev_8_21_14_0_10_36_7]
MEDKVTFISTVLNEENTILKFLDSIATQTRQPDEIIIVDAKSKDKTVELIKTFSRKNKLNIKIIIKKSNRSQGRNIAIKDSQNSIICISDAGCILDSEWLERIVAPFKNKKIDVVSGYYDVYGNSSFAKALGAYVLVMPDRINEKQFLPSSRSMAVRKKTWEKAGMFPNNLNYSEDYLFAKNLKKIEANFVFVKDAIVFWIPGKNLQEAFLMFLRFAKGDIEAGIIRPKVIFIFARYVGFMILIFFALLMHSIELLYIIIFGFIAYLIWAVMKNIKYVKKIGGLFLLPTFQILSDIAVITGTLSASIRKVK